MSLSSSLYQRELQRLLYRCPHPLLLLLSPSLKQLAGRVLISGKAIRIGVTGHCRVVLPLLCIGMAQVGPGIGTPWRPDEGTEQQRLCGLEIRQALMDFLPFVNPNLSIFYPICTTGSRRIRLAS